MNKIIDDLNRDIALFINDYNPEFKVALDKLSKRLARPLRGVILLDSGVKDRGVNKPDSENNFDTIVCDFNDLVSLSDAINGIKNRLLLLSVSSERNQPYLKLVLPHVPYLLAPTESSLDWATHKIVMRQLLRSYDVNLAPKSNIVIRDSETEIQRILRHLKFPMIIKPNGLAASVLVKKVNNESELREVLAESFEVLDQVYVRDSGRGEPSIVVEEFMEGDMYSIDSYVNQYGEVWHLPCIKVTTAASIGLEGYYSYRNDTAHGLSDEQVKAAQAVAAKAVHALGLRSSVAHIELFNTPHGWKIIELGPRAGGYRQDMYYLGYGIDHAYNELLIKVGLEPEIITKPKAYCCIFNMYANEEGMIQSIDGIENAKKISSVYKIDEHMSVGDMATFCGNGGKFVVDGVLSNDSFDELNRDMDKVRSTILISTKDKEYLIKKSRNYEYSQP